MDEKTFTGIVRETKAVVLSAIQGYLPARYRHAIDDIVQETYLRAYRSLVKNRFRGESALSTWLYTIAKNETLRMIQRLDRHDRRRADLNVQEAGSAEPREYFPAPDMECLRKAIGDLPLKYRTVFELAVDGYSDMDISARLELSPGTVKSRKSRGREKLYKLMIKGGYEGHE